MLGTLDDHVSSLLQASNKVGASHLPPRVAKLLIWKARDRDMQFFTGLGPCPDLFPVQTLSRLDGLGRAAPAGLIARHLSLELNAPRHMLRAQTPSKLCARKHGCCWPVLRDFRSWTAQTGFQAAKRPFLRRGGAVGRAKRRYGAYRWQSGPILGQGASQIILERYPRFRVIGRHAHQATCRRKMCEASRNLSAVSLPSTCQSRQQKSPS